MNRAVRAILVVFAVTLACSGPLQGQLVSCNKGSNAPVALDDHAIWPGGAIVIDVLGNDYDDDGDIVTITGFTSPANGTVQYTDDYEALLYTPSSTGANVDTFTYTISDGQFTDTATVRLTDAPLVPPSPPPPQARVWFEYRCNDLTCYFTAYWENIPDTPRYFHWVWGDGTTTPQYYNSERAIHGFAPGAHSVDLVVTFVSGRQVASGALPVSVAVPQVQCSIEVPADGISGLLFDSRVLTLSNSGQPGFDNYQYFWDFGDGRGLQEVDSFSVFQPVGYKYTTPGARTVNFVIRPRGDPTVVGQCPRVVEIVNMPPVPDFTSRQGNPAHYSPKFAFFDAIIADEDQATVKPYEWNFGDGTFLVHDSTAFPQFTERHYYARPGKYQVVLKVTDSLGAAGSVTKEITVPDEAPRNFWVFNCAGRKCSFDASDSIDDSETLTHRWNFGDGTPEVSSVAPTVEHTFPGKGPYDVTLTVEDGVHAVAHVRRVTPGAASPLASLVLYAVTPCTLFDSRGGDPMRDGAPAVVVVAGRCGIPAEAEAVAVNVTVVSPSNGGAVYAFPSGAAIPTGSAVNFAPATSPRSNHFIVPLSASGAIAVHPQVNGGGTVHVVLGVTGYFSSRLEVSDSRSPLRAGVPHWPYRAYASAADPLQPGTPRHVQLRHTIGLLPMNAEAAWLNVHAGSTGAGWLSLYPSGLPAPADTKTLYLHPSTPRSNGSIMPLGRRTADDISLLYQSDTQFPADVSVDGFVWFARDGTYRFHAMEPCRAADTRQPNGGVARLGANGRAGFQIQGNCGVPVGARQVVVVARIIGADAAGVAMIGSSYNREVTNISYSAGDTVANTIVGATAMLAPSPCCRNDFEVELRGGGADVVLDVIGYFVPEENQEPDAVPDVINAVVGVPVTVNVVANDRDGNADALKLSPRGVFNPPALGTATVVSPTSITYTAGGAGSDSFDYEILDSRGATAVGSVQISVRSTNDAPVAVNDIAAATSGAAITVEVVQNDRDPNGETIRLTDTAVVHAPARGTVTRVSDTSLSYLSSGGGDDSLTYEIVNTRGLTARAVLKISVNRLPVANADAVVVQAGAITPIDVLHNDTDPDGQALSLSSPPIHTAPAAGTATVHSDGRRINYTPSGSAGDSFTYGVADPSGASAVGRVTIAVNRAPVAAGDTVQAPVGARIERAVTANDSDADPGDVVRLTAQPFRSYPSKATVSRVSDTTVAIVPGGATGADSFTYEVTDGRGANATATVSLWFCPAMSITAQPQSVSVRRTQPATLSVTATGGDTPRTYQWYRGAAPDVTSPVGTNAATLTVTPAATTRYWVRISDACSRLDSAAATVTVLNNAPQAVATFNCRSNTCDFSSAASTDDVSIAGWQWEFSDAPGVVTSAATVTRTFASGCHVATLTVRDSEGATHTTRQTFAAGDYKPQWPGRSGGVSSDTHALSYRPAGGTRDVNTTGNLNGILEPGERVVVEPTWQVSPAGNVAATATAIASTNSGVSGSIVAHDATYATAGGYANCWATGRCYVVEAAATGSRGVTPHADLQLTENTALPGANGPAIIHVGGSFADVAPTSPSYAVAESLLHWDITSGCGGGNFCPTALLNRAQIAIWILKAKHGPGYTPPACTGTGPFNDVPCSYWAAAWIAQVKAEGISLGTGGGNYLPENAVTRAEMAVFILRTLNGTSYTPPSCATGAEPYTDVPCSHWAAAWIAAFKARGVSVGCDSAGRYCPDAQLNRADAGLFMYRAFSLALDRRICAAGAVHVSNAVAGTDEVQ